MMTFINDAVDVWAAAARFDRNGVAEDEAVAEGERKRVLAEFRLEEWPMLPLERYALGQVQSGSEMTYCRLMEFGVPHLGSIRGGSAAKNIMYRHNCGEWRLAAPLRDREPADAWEQLRGQYIKAFDAVAAEDFDALDDLDLLRFGPALVTKSLAAYFPQHFLPVYSARLSTFSRGHSGECGCWRLGPAVLAAVVGWGCG